MREHRCVSCGEIVPYGRDICWGCEHGYTPDVRDEYDTILQDEATLCSLYRLSRESMKKHNHGSSVYQITYHKSLDCFSITEIGDKTVVTLHFSSDNDAIQAIEFIGKEKLTELFKKY